jgi:hypothetical protein
VADRMLMTGPDLRGGRTRSPHRRPVGARERPGRYLADADVRADAGRRPAERGSAGPPADGSVSATAGPAERGSAGPPADGSVSAPAGPAERGSAGPPADGSVSAPAGPAEDGSVSAPAPGEESWTPWASALAELRRATDLVAAVGLDELGEPDVQAWLEGLQGLLDRLEGAKRRAAGTLRDRAVRRRGPGRESRAKREVDEFLTGRLRLSPADAKRTSDAGRDLTTNPRLGEAVDAGELRPDHAVVIAAATRDLAPEQAERVQRELTAAAAAQDPTELGRTARRLRAQVAPEEAERAQQRARQRRFARFSSQADGSLLINALVPAGLDAETALAWVDKHRTPDAQGEQRSPEQRTCDALLTGMRAGLDDPCGPTVQGVSPHVSVLVTLAELAAGIGCGEASWTGPILMSDVRRLLRNASVTTIVVDDAKLPLTVSKARQQASVGLRRALAARDGGCRMPGCTAPPSWCDVAHGGTPARDDGLLRLDNALLLCRRHHRQVDQPGWRITIRGPDIAFHQPDGRTIRAGPPHRAALATGRAGASPLGPG